MRCSVAVKTVQLNYDIMDQRASCVMAHQPLILSLRPNQAYSTRKNSLLVAFRTAAWFSSSLYLRIPPPANMQEVVKMTRACVARQPQQLPGPIFLVNNSTEQDEVGIFSSDGDGFTTSLSS